MVQIGPGILSHMVQYVTHGLVTCKGRPSALRCRPPSLRNRPHFEQVTCNLNDLAVAKAVTVTVNATAAAPGAQTSTAAVTSGATDLVSANNSASTTMTVSSVRPPSNSGGGGGGGGDLSLYEVLALALIFLGSLLRSGGLARDMRVRSEC
jgi:Domain of unknown function DUF11